MDNYEYSTSVLDGGLDFTKAKLSLPPGTLLDCLNYEIVDRSGYKVIDGLNRYDGRVSPAHTLWKRITSAAYAGTITTDYVVGTYIYLDGETVPFGLVVARGGSAGAYYIEYMVVNADVEPTAIGNTVVNASSAGDFVINAVPADGATANALDAEDTVTRINSNSATARTNIEALSGPSVGLHWFRDKLYAVVDDVIVYFTQASGTTPILHNSLITIAASGATARVLDINLVSGSWAAGTASGSLQIEVLTGTWATSGTVSVTDPTNSTTLTLRAQASTDTEAEYASIHVSRNETQAVEDSEDVGWSRVDMGWQIPYTNGNYYLGHLVKIERGRDNNFTFVTDDTTSASPVSAINGSLISGSFGPYTAHTIQNYGSFPEGIPGWKVTTATSDWATVEGLRSAIASDDSAYAYACSAWYSQGTGNLGTSTPKRVKGNIGLSNVTWKNKATAGGSQLVTLPTDFFSGYARTPIVALNFSALSAQLPEGSVIVGVEASIISKDEMALSGNFSVAKVTAAGGSSAFLQDLIDAGASTHKYYSAIGNYNSNTGSFTPKGSIKQQASGVSTTIGGYTTWYTTSGTSSEKADMGAYSGAGTFTTKTFGGSTDSWGAALSVADIADETLGIAFYARHDDSFGDEIVCQPYTAADGVTLVREHFDGAVQTTVDRIQIKLYYTEPSARYYISDGSGGVASVDLVNYIVAEGSFGSGTASGILQVTNLTPVSGDKRVVVTGDTLHLSSPPSAGNKIADIDFEGASAGTEALTYNGLPSLAEVLEESSKYQFITANFYGNDTWDAFYGVSGAGRAFTYDGEYFYHIYTDTNLENPDKPRHIAFHHFHLALGYAAGDVRMSVKGEADNFDGAFGAAQLGIGDRITGLLPMRGTSLGVFCENSIWSIVGTDFENFATNVLAPSTGCLEYTAVDVGVPIYCDSRGISTLAQSEKYGDFQGSRLSSNITPWLLPRLRKPNKTLDSNDIFTGSGVICAIPVRNKNQYRLFFKDGYILTMTLVGGEMAPQFTFQKYFLEESTVSYTSNKFVVPLAWSSQVDNLGIDRVHISHYSPLSGISQAGSNLVYELDTGWSFDGKFIPYYFTTNWDYGGTPVAFRDMRKINLHGLSYGFSNINVSIASDLLNNYSERAVDISLPRNPDAVFYQDLQPKENINSMAKRGRAFSVRVSNANTDITKPEPSHICQVLIIGSTPLGAFNL